LSKLPVRIASQALSAFQTGWLRQSHLYLHIGLHKTGTTYLQQQISAARPDLREEGLIFPTTGLGMGIFAGPRQGKMAGHIHFGHLFGNEDWAQAGHLLPLLSREARIAKCRRILISVENASYVRHPDRNPLSRHVLGKFGSVDILVYLRRWDRWIESLYKERLEGGETRDFPTFLAEEAWLLDFPARLAEWERLCGPRIRLKVFDYDTARRGAGLLGHFFTEALDGMTPPVERRSDKTANPSLNASQSEALRRFNTAERKTARSREKIDAFLNSAAFKTLEGSEGFFSEAERETFLARFADQNRQILARYDIDLLEP